MPSHIVWISGLFKMVYIDGAYDSKDYGAINHFENDLAKAHIGHNKKKIHIPSN